MGSNTWGVSGSEFVQLFLVAVIAPALGWELWKFYARSKPCTAPTPGPYELALLADGRNRVIETAVAALLEQGKLRPDGRTLALSESSEPPTHPVEAAVWHAVAAQPEFADLLYLRFKVRLDSSIADLTAAAVRGGLLVAIPGQRLALRVMRLAYLAVFLVGFARVAASVENQRPVTGLITVLVIASPIVLILAAITAANIGKLPTRAGDAALSAARRSTADNPSAATAVALGGLAEYPDPTLRTALLTQLDSSTWSGNRGFG